MSSIPPLEGMDPLLSVHQDMFRPAGKTKWVGYISSTSVYSESEGGWVDEGSPTDQSLNRCIAENLWLELGDLEEMRSRVFRCAGIYGPNRNALATLRARKAGNTTDSKLVSRIHVGDLCRGIHASMTSSISDRKRVYNMSDDLPASRRDVFSYAKRLGSISEGDTDLVKLTRRDKSRSSKRVKNARLHNELITDLVYPSYVEGLKDLERTIFNSAKL
uniref:NAD-dependent epimerase/dehydratase domain-containing protein n=1 Tax=Rhodosorus marinus TaxID=101924 RepID=A0A7S0G4I8_9RHOD|mmetsp:Transcript_24854/g.35798  ORF Transcript_24854/g.35798 Transcript_24854/m.35798 type:complete len:218 (+) Transcript_24854:370-1023(+)